MTNKNKYSGVVIPAVTPLNKHFELDHNALEKMFVHFHKHHVMPFINGTTGESASLPLALKKDYLQSAGKLKKNGDILYAGVSANCLAESIELAQFAFDAGIDAVAATLPSYYYLSTDQMRNYFEQLADHVPGPLIIYNIPVTTHMSVPLEVIEELSYHENIIGTKDSERSVERLEASLKLWAGRDDFSHFMGWAGKSADALIGGSDGLIPSTGNICPGIYYDMITAIQSGDHEKAMKLQKLSDALGDLYQKEKLLGESLWALKVLMQELYLCDDYVMPPLQALSGEEKTKLIKNFHQLTDREDLTIKTDSNV